jgi:hypothetical protein
MIITKRFKELVLIFLLLVSVFGSYSYLVYLDDVGCNQHIIFMDNTGFDCSYVRSYYDGTSLIRKCDGTQIIVPNERIKEIRKI